MNQLLGSQSQPATSLIARLVVRVVFALSILAVAQVSGQEEFEEIGETPIAESAPAEPVQTQEDVSASATWPPDLLLVRDGWQANPEDVRAVLHSTGRELWQHFPDRRLEPLIIYPQGGPITLYARGPINEIVIQLNTGNTFWSQYAFQFSHELCHVLAGYDQDPHGNDWFEESICELASLYTLRRMGETWKTDPPYDHWKDFSPNLTNYASDRIEPYRLKDGQTLADWHREHADALRSTATNRELNNVAAVALLDLFEAEQEHWNAISFLNAAEPAGPQTLEQYLRDWHQHCPEMHQPFVAKIALRFEIDLSR